MEADILALIFPLLTAGRLSSASGVLIVTCVFAMAVSPLLCSRKSFHYALWHDRSWLQAAGSRRRLSRPLSAGKLTFSALRSGHPRIADQVRGGP